MTESVIIECEDCGHRWLDVVDFDNMGRPKTKGMVCVAPKCGSNRLDVKTERDDDE
jgi:Zn finger protein HypA/HybF involved in hydrogenase expression